MEKFTSKIDAMTYAINWFDKRPVVYEMKSSSKIVRFFCVGALICEIIEHDPDDWRIRFFV